MPVIWAGEHHKGRFLFQVLQGGDGIRAHVYMRAHEERFSELCRQQVEDGMLDLRRKKCSYEGCSKTPSLELERTVKNNY